jgi:hypothetical protein
VLQQNPFLTLVEVLPEFLGLITWLAKNLVNTGGNFVPAIS